MAKTEQEHIYSWMAITPTFSLNSNRLRLLRPCDVNQLASTESRSRVAEIPRAPKVTVTREGDTLCQKGVTQWLMFSGFSIPYLSRLPQLSSCWRTRPYPLAVERSWDRLRQQPDPAQRNRQRVGAAGFRH